MYELNVDLRPGVRDLEFTAALDQYLGKLQMDGLIEGWRLLRSKLGLGAAREFKVLIETRNLAQLDTAFNAVSTRDEPVEGSPPRCQFARHQLPRRAVARLPRHPAGDRERTVLMPTTTTAAQPVTVPMPTQNPIQPQLGFRGRCLRPPPTPQQPKPHRTRRTEL